MDGFEVNVAAVNDHAKNVGSTAAQVTAACKIAQAALQGNAFGMIGQFLVMALLSACGDVRDAIMKGAQAFTDIQQGLKAAGQLYDEVDKAHAELMKLIEGESAK